MESISELLLLAQDLLLVLQPVAQCDVLQAVLVHLLVLGGIGIFPFFDLLGRQLLAVTAVDRILRHRPFQLLELVFNLLTLGLLLVELGLQLASHAVVTILGVFQVEADLVHVGERVEVLVVAHHLVGLRCLLLLDCFAKDDPLLERQVGLLQLFVLGKLILDSFDQLFSHVVLGDSVDIVVLLAHFVLLQVLLFIRLHGALSALAFVVLL